MSTGDDVGYLSTGSGAVLIGRNSRKLTNLTEDITSTNHNTRSTTMYDGVFYTSGANPTGSQLVHTAKCLHQSSVPAHHVSFPTIDD